MTSEQQSKLARYVEGKLSPDERMRFIGEALHDQELYNALADEHGFADRFQNPEFRRQVDDLLARVQSQPDVSSRKPVLWAMTIAAIIALAVLLPIKLRRSSIPAAGKTAVSTLPPRPPNDGSRPGSEKVITWLILPTERSPVVGNDFVTPGSGKTIRLTLKSETLEKGRFSVVLEKVDGGAIATFAASSVAHVATRPDELGIDIASDLLQPGDYLIRVYQSNGSDRQSVVAGYSFRVDRAR